MRKFIVLSCFSIVLLFLSTQAYSAVNHKVRSGETLQKIARKYHVSVDKIKAANNLSSSALKKGQVLVIGQDGAAGRSTKARRSTKPAKRHAEAPAIEEASRDENNEEYVEYRVKRGDTLDKVARKFNITRNEIIELNKINRRRLSPGMTVLIPREDGQAEEEAPIVLNDHKPLKPWKNEEERGILVKVAKSFAGAPYKYGGDSVRGLDCSAFVKKMYEIFEVQLPRSAREQFHSGPKVEKENLVTGDLVFFKTKRYVKYPTHVGIYIGENKFIHASSLLKRGVKVDCLADSYFTRTYMGAVRVKAPPSTEKSETDKGQPKPGTNT